MFNDIKKDELVYVRGENSQSSTETLSEGSIYINEQVDEPQKLAQNQAEELKTLHEQLALAQDTLKQKTEFVQEQCTTIERQSSELTQLGSEKIITQLSGGAFVGIVVLIAGLAGLAIYFK